MGGEYRSSPIAVRLVIGCVAAHHDAPHDLVMLALERETPGDRSDLMVAILRAEAEGKADAHPRALHERSVSSPQPHVESATETRSPPASSARRSRFFGTLTRAMNNAPAGTPIEVWVGGERAYIAMRTKDFAKALARGPR